MDVSYGRDVFYEESSIAHNFQKEEKRYKVAHVASIICLIIGIISVLLCINFIPIPVSSSGESASADAVQMTQSGLIFLCILFGGNGLFFLAAWFVLFKLKSRLNVSYDYCFVSGELRIAKIVNINKRKLIARFDCTEIIQIGDMENTAYERFRADPSIKEVVCTSNIEAAEGKFFMYILINDNGKKMYLLECREELLVNILKFASRSVLEKDYVPQEKKQR